jgi:preprotein translocase subunit YajC
MNNTGLLFPLLILLLFIPILLSGRRQKRQVAQMQQLQSSLTEGDVVVTTSGLRGTIVDSSYEDTVDLEIAPGVVTTWVRQAIREKVNPPVDGDSATGGLTGRNEPPAGMSQPIGEPDRTSADTTTQPAEPTDGGAGRPTAPGDSAAPGGRAETGADEPVSDPTSGTRTSDPTSDSRTSDPTSGRGA